jgi:hypothetical protein
VAHLVTFATRKFDPSKEEPNDINPIAGQALLQWLSSKLVSAGFKTTEPETEDWGWYIEVEGSAGEYLVGASGEPETRDADVEWTIQIHRCRSLKDKVTGKNKLAADDPLTVLVENVMRSEPDFRDIHVDKDA